MQTIPVENLAHRAPVEQKLTEISVEQFLEEELAPELLASALPDVFSQQVVERLKQEADRYWYIDPDRSLLLADRIMAIAERRGDARQRALGMLARGNALKFKGQWNAAWDELGRAGEMFLAADDDEGWARTRISRLELGVRLNHVSQVLADAERAGAVLMRRDNQEMLMRLHSQTALVHSFLGDQRSALPLLESALCIAESLGERTQQSLGPLYTNIGFAYDSLGDYDQALHNYELARAHYSARNETQSLIVIEHNLAVIAQARGQFRHALELYHSAIAHATGKAHPYAIAARRDLVGCYLYLNRFAEARDLAEQVLAEAQTLDDQYSLGRTHLNLAVAEAELGNYLKAQQALEAAAEIFKALNAPAWIAQGGLRQARLALKQGQPLLAIQRARDSAAYFEMEGQQAHWAAAILLEGQAAQSLHDWGVATAGGHQALRIAKRYNVPGLRHSAHLLLGQTAEAAGDVHHAMRRYQAASAAIDRVQRGLTITLRPGFLEDKTEALRALMALQLRLGQGANAFETLERAKSQVLLGYVLNREQLRWTSQDAQNRALIEELGRLRAEHHRYFERAYGLPQAVDRPGEISPDEARRGVAEIERRIHAITEQLYLRGAGDLPGFAAIPSLRDIQQIIPEDSALVEYYADGAHLWAFSVRAGSLHVQLLPSTPAAVNQLQAQLQAHMAAALRMASGARQMTELARRLLQRLHGALIAPLAPEVLRAERLIIVPYGSLHYLPFHLLHDGSAYLIERHEVVGLPAAGLATRTGPARPPGALVLAHTWEGRLPNVHAEGRLVQELLGGQLFVDGDTRRSLLAAPPLQVLHIAAHGQHRLDQPDLSFVQLGDGQMFADDLLQQDLSYELVTLSACETARARVGAHDELIGLGRGFLYAGAGALLASLWPVADTSTFDLMTKTYRALRSGLSKAAALRQAQQQMLAQERDLHPSQWGAFQLIGDAQPLTKLMPLPTDVG